MKEETTVTVEHRGSKSLNLLFSKWIFSICMHLFTFIFSSYLVSLVSVFVCIFLPENFFALEEEVLQLWGEVYKAPDFEELRPKNTGVGFTNRILYCLGLRPITHCVFKLSLHFWGRRGTVSYSKKTFAKIDF